MLKIKNSRTTLYGLNSCKEKLVVFPVCGTGWFTCVVIIGWLTVSHISGKSGGPGASEERPAYFDVSPGKHSPVGIIPTASGWTHGWAHHKNTSPPAAGIFFLFSRSRSETSFSGPRKIKKPCLRRVCFCDPGGTQTPNLLIRSQVLYSVKLRDQSGCKDMVFFQKPASSRLLCRGSLRSAIIS